MLSEERYERLRQQQTTIWAICDLVHKRRPDLYPDDDDVSGIMGAVDRAWKRGMTAEEVYAAALPELEARATRSIDFVIKEEDDGAYHIIDARSGLVVGRYASLADVAKRQKELEAMNGRTLRFDCDLSIEPRQQVSARE